METIIIPVMLFAIPLLAIWTHHQRKMRSIESRANPKLEQEIAALRERVEVLERIATDGNPVLVSKFRELA
jgi:hypothetical protein